MGEVVMLNKHILSEQIRTRLLHRFNYFQDARRKIHERRATYVIDYSMLEETNAFDRYEELRELYKDDAPILERLHKIEETGQILWFLKDASIVIGKDASSISRTIQNMENNEEWLEKLSSIRHYIKVPDLNENYLYEAGIFDLIVDFYEQSYLNRLTCPRRGAEKAQAEQQAIHDYWTYLKNKYSKMSYNSEKINIKKEIKENILHQGETSITFNGILQLIVSRMFTIQLGTFFAILFGLYFEASRRYPILVIVTPIFCASALFSSIILIKKRIWIKTHLATFAAGSILFLMLWGISVITGNSPYQKTVPKIAEIKNPVAVNIMDGNDSIYFQIRIAESAKNIYYRIDGLGQFESTGFTHYKDPKTDDFVPNPSIAYNNKNRTDPLELEIKYLDKNNVQKGPYKFTIHLQEEIKKYYKSLLLQGKERWLLIHMGFQGVEATFANLLYPQRCIQKIMYGLNKEVPDLEFTMPLNHFNSVIDLSQNPGVSFISVELTFYDGEKSGIVKFVNTISDEAQQINFLMREGSKLLKYGITGEGLRLDFSSFLPYKGCIEYIQYGTDHKDMNNKFFVGSDPIIDVPIVNKVLFWQLVLRNGHERNWSSLNVINDHIYKKYHFSIDDIWNEIDENRKIPQDNIFDLPSNDDPQYFSHGLSM